MPRITAIVNDLMFMTKIRNAAEYLGLSVGFPASQDQIDHYLEDCNLVLVDLENDFLEPIELIERMKSTRGPASPKIVGYLSHLNSLRKSEAISAGCDEVLSRFEINSNLREILQAMCI